MNFFSVKKAWWHSAKLLKSPKILKNICHTTSEVITLSGHNFSSVQKSINCVTLNVRSINHNTYVLIFGFVFGLHMLTNLKRYMDHSVWYFILHYHLLLLQMTCADELRVETLAVFTCWWCSQRVREVQTRCVMHGVCAKVGELEATLYTPCANIYGDGEAVIFFPAASQFLYLTMCYF